MRIKDALETIKMLKNMELQLELSKYLSVTIEHKKTFGMRSKTYGLYLRTGATTLRLLYDTTVEGLVNQCINYSNNSQITASLPVGITAVSMWDPIDLEGVQYPLLQDNLKEIYELSADSANLLLHLFKSGPLNHLQYNVLNRHLYTPLVHHGLVQLTDIDADSCSVNMTTLSLKLIDDVLEGELYQTKVTIEYLLSQNIYTHPVLRAVGAQPASLSFRLFAYAADDILSLANKQKVSDCPQSFYICNKLLKQFNLSNPPALDFTRWLTDSYDDRLAEHLAAHTRTLTRGLTDVQDMTIAKILLAIDADLCNLDDILLITNKSLDETLTLLIRLKQWDYIQDVPHGSDWCAPTVKTQRLTDTCSKLAEMDMAEIERIKLHELLDDHNESVSANLSF